MHKSFLAAAALLFVLTPGSHGQEHSAQGTAQPSDQTQAPDQAKSQAQSQAQPEPSPAVTSAQGADQTPAPQTESIAEAARRTREKKKDSARPAKVFTNEDIPASASASDAGANPATEAAAGPATAAAGANSGKDEKAWRARFASLNHKLEQDQQDLDVLQRELGVLSLQYYNDPVKGMQQGLTRSDINDQNAKIDKKKQDVEDDKQALTNAEDDLRKAGGDPGWAR